MTCITSLRYLKHMVMHFITYVSEWSLKEIFLILWRGTSVVQWQQKRRGWIQRTVLRAKGQSNLKQFSCHAKWLPTEELWRTEKHSPLHHKHGWRKNGKQWPHWHLELRRRQAVSESEENSNLLTVPIKEILLWKEHGKWVVAGLGFKEKRGFF